MRTHQPPAPSCPRRLWLPPSNMSTRYKISLEESGDDDGSLEYTKWWMEEINRRLSQKKQQPFIKQSQNRARAGGCEALGCCTTTCILLSERAERKEGQHTEGGLEWGSMFSANPEQSHDSVWALHQEGGREREREDLGANECSVQRWVVSSQLQLHVKDRKSWKLMQGRPPCFSGLTPDSDAGSEGTVQQVRIEKKAGRQAGVSLRLGYLGY